MNRIQWMNSSPVYSPSILKLWWTPARTVRRRELQHLALRICFRSFESFMGVQGKKKREKWSSFRKESIINQACIFGRLLRERQFNPSITFKPLLYSNLWGNMKGKISGWFTRTFSWRIDLVRMYLYEASSVPKMYVFHDGTASILSYVFFLFYIAVTLCIARVWFCLASVTWHGTSLTSFACVHRLG